MLELLLFERSDCLALRGLVLAEFLDVLVVHVDSSVKMTGFLKMPLFIFVIFAQFQALTAKFR